MNEIERLHGELAVGTYRHSAYDAFKINDPKPRDIHKATVRDRLLHHAICRILYPFFDRTWVSDSYSCRVGKGTHRAMDRFRAFAWKVSKNHTKTCWVLKCDIRKFFASIDHAILLSILGKYIPDARTLGLLRNVIESFTSTGPGEGLPLGNLTSQLLVNVYMNEFDQFAKHQLKGEHYIRYADDFVFLSTDRAWLESLIPRIREFLRTKLDLELHPHKLSISTFASGVDFLGWVHFTDHRVLRAASRKRMGRTMRESTNPEASRLSYLGMLTHGNAHGLSQQFLTKTI